MRDKDQILLENLYTGIGRKGRCLECGCQLTKEDIDNSKKLANTIPLTEAKQADCNGVIVYHGVSNGENIVAIATGLVNKSQNRKTGPMVQLWILHADVSPVNAIKSGQDVGICGNCIHRKAKGGACYVNPGQAPEQIFASYKKGNYPFIVDDIKNFEEQDITTTYVNHGMWNIFQNSYVRFGAYGDPSFIPFAIIEKIAQNCKGFTGYTHQWKTTNQAYQQYFMASVDFPWEYNKAKSMGWRTFRVTPEWTEKSPGEIPCLNSSKDLKCIDCLLCCGTSKKAKDIYIKVHGATAKKFVQIFGTQDDHFDEKLTPADLKQIEMVEKKPKPSTEEEKKPTSKLGSLAKRLGVDTNKPKESQETE